MHSSLRASKNVFIRLFYSMQTRLDVLGLKLYVLSCWVEEINLIFIVQNYKQRPRNTFEFIVPPSFSNREEIILEEGKNENRAAAAF